MCVFGLARKSKLKDEVQGRIDLLRNVKKEVVKSNPKMDLEFWEGHIYGLVLLRDHLNGLE